MLPVDDHLREAVDRLSKQVAPPPISVIAKRRRNQIIRKTAFAACLAAAVSALALLVPMAAFSDKDSQVVPGDRQHQLVAPGIRAEALSTSVNPAGLRRHFVVLSPSAVVLSYRMPIDCRWNLESPLRHGGNVSFTVQGPDPTACVGPTPSAPDRMSPQTVIVSKPLFNDNVSTITIVDKIGSGSSVLTRVSKDAVDLRGTPAVLTGRIDLPEGHTARQEVRLQLLRRRGSRLVWWSNLPVQANGTFEGLAQGSVGGLPYVLRPNLRGATCPDVEVTVIGGTVITQSLACT